jgi:hypothetical protein
MEDGLAARLRSRYWLLAERWKQRWPEEPLPPLPDDTPEGVAFVCRTLAARLNNTTPFRVTVDPMPFCIPERRRPEKKPTEH